MREMKTILAVTTEPELAQSLCRDLESAGHRSVYAQDGETAMKLLRRGEPDLVFLDLAWSGPLGLEFCRQLREMSDVPVLVLTACLDEAELVVADEMYADDFLQKPCSSKQVVARVQALLHRAERQRVVHRNVIRAGDLELNMDFHQTTVAGVHMDLTRTEQALLAALAAQPGRTFTRAQLMGVLNSSRCLSHRTIDSHIKNLRAKVEPDPRNPRYVLTVHGGGYRLGSGGETE
jgi:DNA-binding response OmpR family regulator